MSEIWLRPNRRVLAIGFIYPALLAFIGSACCFAQMWYRESSWPTLVGLGLWAPAGYLFAVTVYSLRLPRLELASGQLRVYLGRSRPEYIPIESVDCILAGQSNLSLRSKGIEDARTSTLILRLSDAVEARHGEDVRGRYGHRDREYVTLYGAWCEPIDERLIRRLNRQLVAAQQKRLPAERPLSEGSDADSGAPGEGSSDAVSRARTPTAGRPVARRSPSREAAE